MLKIKKSHFSALFISDGGNFVFKWHPDVRYRNIHGFHILINLKTNKSFEISETLAILFAELNKNDFSIAYRAWLRENSLLNNEETVINLLDNLCKLELLKYVE
ncbi:hypothetical protein TPSD3_03810 [Thioflexithrix psekupsensis]|uniref:PqqD family protein n=1 Tax=Thioflexithrix psekupsensis TaxID=1570016 RepID=A0A251XCL6_9GAMM|nr:hypothetical protein TPSD3_03810 [Thioflexithrix psekupsensis]